MRHRISGKKLNRTVSHRRATLNSLSTQLLRHKKIKTTLAKAKVTRSYVEPLITRAKNDTVANRRYVARFIKDKDVHKELFNEIAPAIGDRPGGYTRVVKLGARRGDSAEMAIIELVDYGEAAEKSAPAGETSKTKKEKAKPKAEEKQVEEAEVVEETAAEAESEEPETEKDETQEEETSAKETSEEEQDEKTEPKGEDSSESEDKSDKK